MRVHSSHARSLLLIGFCLLFLSLTTVWGQDADSKKSDAGTRQFAAAAALQNKGLFGLAIDEWELFLKKFPKDERVPLAKHYLGVCQMKTKKYDEAVKTFTALIKAHPKFDKLDETYLNLGVTQYSMGTGGKAEAFDAAAGTFSTMEEKFEKSKFLPQAIYYRGESLYARGKKEEAIGAYQKFVKNHADNALAADAMYALGVTQEETKQADAAGKTYDAFLGKFEKHPLVPEIQYRRGELHFAGGSFADAAAMFEKAAAAKEFALKDYALIRQAACFYQLKEFDKAEKLYGSVEGRFPQSQYLPLAHLSQGKCFYSLGKFGPAREALAKVAGKPGPHAAEAGHWVARSWLKTGDAAKALKAAQTALALENVKESPYFVPLKLDRADAMYEIPDQREASVGQYVDIVKNHPEDPAAPEALYMAAFASLGVGQQEQALAHAKSFLEKFPQTPFEPDVLYIAAEANLLQKDFAAAEGFYKQLREKHPQHEMSKQAVPRLGLALYLQKKYDESVKFLTDQLASVKDPATVAEMQHFIGRSLSDQDNYEAGAKALEASLQAKADWRQADETRLVLGHAYSMLDKAEPAIEQLRTLLKQFPDSAHRAEAHYRLAELLNQSGQHKPAAEQYTAVIEKHADSSFKPHAVYGLGWAQFSQNDFAAADKSWSRLLKEHAEHELASQTLYARALSRQQLKEFDGAVEDLTKYLGGKLEAKDKSDAQYLLGLCQAGQGKNKEAVATFQKVLEENPKYAAGDKVLYELGWAHKALDEQEPAAAAFGKLATNYPDSEFAAEASFHVGENHYTAKAYDEAVKSYQQVLKKVDKGELAEKAAHKLGWAFYRQEAFDKAAAQFAEQTKAHPEGRLLADGTFMQAECLFKQSQYDKALPVYEQTVALFDKAEKPNESFYQLALLHAAQTCARIKEKNWERSLQLVDNFLKKFEKSPYLAEAYYAQAWALQNTGKPDEALEIYSKVTDASDAEVAARAWFMRGEIYFGQKDHKEAIKNFFKAAYGYGYPEWAANSLFEAGRCFEVLKQSPQAIKMYEELIKKYPESDKVKLARTRLNSLKGE